MTALKRPLAVARHGSLYEQVRLARLWLPLTIVGVVLVHQLVVLGFPDFPTAGQIVGDKGIEEAYTTGRGSIRMRGVVRAGGRPSGGTFHSALTAFSRANQMRQASSARRKVEPRPEGRSARATAGRPGLDHLVERQRRRRDELFAEAGRTWSRLGDQAVWEKLVQTLDRRLRQAEATEPTAERPDVPDAPPPQATDPRDDARAANKDSP